MRVPWSSPRVDRPQSHALHPRRPDQLAVELAARLAHARPAAAPRPAVRAQLRALPRQQRVQRARCRHAVARHAHRGADAARVPGPLRRGCELLVRHVPARGGTRLGSNTTTPGPSVCSNHPWSLTSPIILGQDHGSDWLSCFVRYSCVPSRFGNGTNYDTYVKKGAHTHAQPSPSPMPPETPPPAMADWPVTYVSLREAREYCKWAGGRLPHAWEWSYAAQGNGFRNYPCACRTHAHAHALAHARGGVPSAREGAASRHGMHSTTDRILRPPSDRFRPRRRGQRHVRRMLAQLHRRQHLHWPRACDGTLSSGRLAVWRERPCRQRVAGPSPPAAGRALAAAHPVQRRPLPSYPLPQTRPPHGHSHPRPAHPPPSAPPPH
jgi:hypothetical protein